MNILKNALLSLIFSLYILLNYSICKAALLNDAITKVEKAENNVVFYTKGYTLTIKIIKSNIIEVLYLPEKSSALASSLIVRKNPNIDHSWDLKSLNGYYQITTEKLNIAVSKTNGSVTFYDKAGMILKENEKGRVLSRSTFPKKPEYFVEQKFDFQESEALYGLGQHQEGIMDYRGHNVLLAQMNTDIAVPLLVSTKGYGILWDNYSLTEFKDAEHEGSISSNVGNGINYYFIYGPMLDTVINGYRLLTGQAPMFAKWAFGLWQSKCLYSTQEEVLTIASEYRKRDIPLDLIVQDAAYWQHQGGFDFDPRRYPNAAGMVKELNEKYHLKTMVSVWPDFVKGTPIYDSLNAKGFLMPQSKTPNGRFYDPYNPKAREHFGQLVFDSLFKKGFDSYFLDASEPEIGDLADSNTMSLLNNYIGTGAEFLNTYPLMNSKAVYEFQRQKSNDKRYLGLTRSGFAGLQSNATAVWSGDVYATWAVFHNQISAGINCGLSGIPYWTTDIGGFTVMYPDGCKNPAYQELFVRWFQFGTFCPLFRVHGNNTPREMWQFGDTGTWQYETQLRFDNLRYRLLPYIYSLSHKVTSEGYTIMRGLAFDFPNDHKGFKINDQFMFGSSILVCPVTRPVKFLEDEGALIPSENLYNLEGKKGGLSAQYYDGKDFEKLKVKRTDETVNFQFFLRKPHPLVAEDNFSVRWQGEVLTKDEGEYTFLTYSDDGVRLWVNDSLLIDDWTARGAEYRSGLLKLKKNAKYKIKLEYFDGLYGGNISLRWKFNNNNNQERTFREVYLPADNGWFDFWTGEYFKGGQSIKSPAPLTSIPLFVKAGSIIPFGPYLQYSSEKQTDTIELRIYPGSNCDFVLYEDEGDNYNYENGAYSRISILWDEKSQTLTIGKRTGEFKGMLKNRVFSITLVSRQVGAGIDYIKQPDKTVQYVGEEIFVQLRE